jgi:hypothetical protein
MGPQQQESTVELHPPPPTIQEEGSIQGLWGEEGCPQDGDGAPLGCDIGGDHPFTGRPARD